MKTNTKTICLIVNLRIKLGLNKLIEILTIVKKIQNIDSD